MTTYELQRVRVMFTDIKVKYNKLKASNPWLVAEQAIVEHIHSLNVSTTIQSRLVELVKTNQ